RSVCEPLSIWQTVDRKINLGSDQQSAMNRLARNNLEEGNNVQNSAAPKETSPVADDCAAPTAIGVHAFGRREVAGFAVRPHGQGEVGARKCFPSKATSFSRPKAARSNRPPLCSGRSEGRSPVP